MTTTPTSAKPLLRPAVAALRAALRRLEDDDVPAQLQKVARTTGGRLPPPLERKLLDVVEAEPWLRDKAAEELDEAAAGPAAEASRLYLTRPAGWWERLGELAAARSEAGEDRRVEELQREIARLEGALVETQRRLKQAAAEPAAAPRPPEEEELRAQLAAARVAARKAAEEQHRAAAAAEARASDAEAAATGAGRHADRLRAELRSTRRDRAALQRELDELRRSPGATRMGPVDLARRLDELAARARPSPAPAASAPVPAEAATALRLPSGVRPDGADAVDWLVRCEEPVLVLVDGYNVSYHLAPGSFSTPAARQRLNQELSRLATMGRSLRVVVVYDSSLAGDAEEGSGPTGVEVVFAAAGRLADEEIVDRASSAKVPVVVVSTDREVRDSAEHAGALPLWGEALATWIRKRA